MPYWLCVKDKDRLERFNSRFYAVMYAFVTIFTCVVFLAINLLLVPFAYLKTCWHKISLARHSLAPTSDAVFYVLAGLPMGIIV